MRIVFVLPCRSAVPIGGFSVVYRYANLLTERGHEVSVLHPRRFAPPRALGGRIRANLWRWRYCRRPELLAPWFRFAPGVQLPASRHLGDGPLPSADAVVATTWPTAATVVAATAAAGRGFFFIQGDEGEGSLEGTEAWTLPLQKIVVSRWLEEKAIGLGEGPRTSYVPNGTDTEQWGIDLPVERRQPRIGALLGDGKGREEILAALQIARTRVPELLVAAFGTEPPPRDLPEWVEYLRLPSPERLRALYNSCSVFMQASRSEGWGLPATEAMACGCALVTCDNGGSREYATDGETALVVEPTPEGLADATTRLLADRELRLRLAQRGAERVASFSWERSVDSLERVLAGSR
jgi:glycosyltransferase involved in cell wall biosynthesis